MTSLPVPNGPMMQLLVLDLSFSIILMALAPVASTMTGMLSLVWTVWYILTLLPLGSTILSSIRLGWARRNVLSVWELLDLKNGLKLLVRRMTFSTLDNVGLLLMIRICFPMLLSP